jgi:transcriptional regulator with XRE-family HTH domain
MSQEALGHASGLHATEISHLESGRRNPKFDTIRKVTRGLEIPRWQLMWVEELFESEPESELPE